MKDDEKTKEPLVHALSELRSQNAELKKSITGSISAELAAGQHIDTEIYLVDRAEESITSPMPA